MSDFQTSGIVLIPLDGIIPHKHNRKTFSEEAIEELAQSIRQIGLLQPIVVRSFSERVEKAGGEVEIARYEIVCGERRWRAAKAAGLSEIACTIRELSDSEALMALVVENSQREDVNPIDQAEGFQALLDAGFKVEEIAQRIGKSTRHVYSCLQLGGLGAVAQAALRRGALGAVHGVLLAGIEDEQLQAEMSDLAETQGLSTRALAEQIQVRQEPKAPTAKKAPIFDRAYFAALLDAVKKTFSLNHLEEALTLKGIDVADIRREVEGRLGQTGAMGETDSTPVVSDLQPAVTEAPAEEDAAEEEEEEELVPDASPAEEVKPESVRRTHSGPLFAVSVIAKARQKGSVDFDRFEYQRHADGATALQFHRSLLLPDPDDEAEWIELFNADFDGITTWVVPGGKSEPETTAEPKVEPSESPSDQTPETTSAEEAPPAEDEPAAVLSEESSSAEARGFDIEAKAGGTYRVRHIPGFETDRTDYFKITGPDGAKSTFQPARSDIAERGAESVAREYVDALARAAKGGGGNE